MDQELKKAYELVIADKTKRSAEFSKMINDIAKQMKCVLVVDQNGNIVSQALDINDKDT